MKNSYWLGDESSLQEFFKFEEKLHTTNALDLQQLAIGVMAEAASDEGEFKEYDYMVTRHDNVGVVNISGSLVSQYAPYNRYYGRVSYDEIRNAVFAAADNPAVEAILLNLDTPGGQATGIAELSDFLKQVDTALKPVYTYTGSIMASGGYWIGSVGREIFSSRMSTVGSIGVVTVHASYAKMYKDLGIEITVLRAGEFKALGSPYEKLDEKARAQLESQMDAIYGVFLETVADHRGMTVATLKSTAAEGRIFMGADAVTVGLVDHIASFDDTVHAVSQKARRTSGRQTNQQSSGIYAGEPMGKRKVLTAAAVAAVASGASEQDLLNDPKMVEEVEVGEEASGEAASAQAAAGEQPPAGEGDAAPAADAAPAGAAPAPGADAALIDKMFNKITDLTVQLANVTAELSQTKQRLDVAVATESALVKVAIQAINRMEVGLGNTPSKLSDVTASVVLEQYNRVHSTFCQKFKVGSAAKVPTDEDTVPLAEAQENTTLASAAHRLTTARVGGMRR